MAREIRITIGDKGELDVWEGDKHTERLCFGEMLETITDLCHPKLPGIARYAMLTAAEWNARHKRDPAEDAVTEWPRTVTAYVRSDEVGMLNIGVALGLTGEALSLFGFALTELAITISVAADGTYKILEVKG